MGWRGLERVPVAPKPAFSGVSAVCHRACVGFLGVSGEKRPNLSRLLKLLAQRLWISIEGQVTVLWERRRQAGLGQ